MDIITKHDNTLISLSKSEPTYDHTWVGSDPNRAFVICIGAGPWRVDRRRKVQEKALRWLGNKDLYDIKEIYMNEFKIYPFNWQNWMVYNVSIQLKSENIKFSDKCSKWKKNKNSIWNNNWKDHIEEFFEMCGATKKGTKVLWLFVRDYLQLPAFPIDRWVKRILVKHELPQDSWYIINRCLKIGINPNRLNRSLFFGSNPDFSEENKNL